MRDQFLLLLELQHLDDRLHALQVEQHELPQQLHSYELTCKETRQELARVHDDIEDTERQRRVRERELENSQAQLVKTRNKLREVKTNKEYSAVQAEIATGAQHIATLEDQVLELMEAIEQRRQTYQIQERRVQESAQELIVQEKQVQQAQADLARQITVEEAKRQQLVADLDAKLYAVYQRFATQRDRQAVVLIQDGTCEGCHLKVQPQLVSEVRQQDKLITCPHCKRILLWPAE